MKTTFTYIAIDTLLLALAIGLIYRGTRSSSLDAEQAASLFGKGMPQSLMTTPAHTRISTDDVSSLMERSRNSFHTPHDLRTILLLTGNLTSAAQGASVALNGSLWASVIRNTNA
jgi:hypothetical protein